MYTRANQHIRLNDAAHRAVKPINNGYVGLGIRSERPLERGMTYVHGVRH